MPYTLQQIQNKTIDADFDTPSLDGSIWDKARQFNADLAKQDQGAAYELAYQLAMTKARLDTTVQPLLDTIAKAREAGEPLTAGQVAQERKYRDLMAQLDRELDQYATKAGALIRYTNDLAVQSAVEMARQSTLAALQPSEPVKGAAAKVVGTWNELPSDVLKQIVASDATSWLKGLNRDTRDRVQVDLLAGVAAGKGQREIAKAIDGTLGGHLGRAMTIARTEHHRAQREATRATYEANSDIVKGWVWRCSRTGRTCAICWGMDGQEFSTQNAAPATGKSAKGTPAPVTPRMHTHVNCRCTMVPLTRSWAELGFPGIPDIPKQPTGKEIFATLPDAVQRQILGPGKYKAFKAGDLALTDLVAGGENRHFGRYRYERSLADALENASKRKAAQARNVDTDPDRALWHQAEQARQDILSMPGADELAQLKNDLENLRAEMKILLEQQNNFRDKAYKAHDRGDIAKRDELDAQYRTTRNKYDEKYQEFRQKQDRIVELYNQTIEQARRMLSVSDPVNVRYSFSNIMNGTERSMAKKGVDAFNQLVSNRHAEDNTLDIDVVLGKNQRSYQAPGGGIFMGGYSTEKTYVHEMAHWLEEHDAGAHQDIIDFLERRTKGLTPQWLGEGYDKSEVSIADNFIHPYVGKDYIHNGRRFASEVLSMGLENFYQDPIVFARKDPEHFQLTYVLARGGRWNPPPPSADQADGV